MSNSVTFFNHFTFYDTDLYSLILQCAVIGLLYASVQSSFRDSLKKQAWLVMLLLSAVLAASSIVYGVYVEFNGGYTVENVFAENKYSRAVVTFFAASNIMDLFIGLFCYPSYMDPFTTYFHHAFYISCCAAYIGSAQTFVFILGFFVEIPTVLLNVGVVLPKLRTDLPYGVIFFIFRIIYHIIFVYRIFLVDESGISWKMALIPFPAHVLWFYKWLQGYLNPKPKKN
jgi:hypothetical protein